MRNPTKENAYVPVTPFEGTGCKEIMSVIFAFLLLPTLPFVCSIEKTPFQESSPRFGRLDSDVRWAPGGSICSTPLWPVQVCARGPAPLTNCRFPTALPAAAQVSFRCNAVMGQCVFWGLRASCPPPFFFYSLVAGGKVLGFLPLPQGEEMNYASADFLPCLAKRRKMDPMRT